MINCTVYQGRLTADPELGKTASDVSYLNFTLAWSEKYKEIEKKCFLRCKAWRHTAEFIAKHFTKGKEIMVRGKLLTEEWEQDGKKQSRTVLEIEEAHFCGSKSDNGGNNQHQPSSPGDFEEIDDDEDLPF